MNDSQLKRARHLVASFLLDEEISCSNCAEFMNLVEEVVTRYLEIRARIESQRKEELIDAYRIFNERKILDGLVSATREAERRDPESYRAGS